MLRPFLVSSVLTFVAACSSPHDDASHPEAPASEGALTTSTVVNATALSHESAGKIAVANNSEVSIASPSAGLSRLGTSTVGVSGIEYDGTNVYYGAATGVFQMDQTGHESQLAKIPSYTLSTVVGLDGDAIYVVAQEGSVYSSRGVFRVSKTTGAVTKLATAGGGNYPDVLSFTAAGGKAYWADVFACNGPGCPDEPTVIVHQMGDGRGWRVPSAFVLGQPAVIKLVGKDLYMASRKGIFRLRDADLRGVADVVCQFPSAARVALGEGTLLVGMPDGGFDGAVGAFLVPEYSADRRHAHVARADATCALTAASPDGSPRVGMDDTLGNGPIGQIRAVGSSVYWLDRVDGQSFRLMLTKP